MVDKRRKKSKATEQDIQEIELFCDHVWMEQGLSDATLSSYRTDLKLFASWLKEQGQRLLSVGEGDIQSYSADREPKNTTFSPKVIK